MVEELGGRAVASRCDVTRSEDVRAALADTIDAFGRLDAAFNNAGVEQPVTATADITEQEWERIVATNLRGVLLCMKHEIPLLLEHGGGAIVNTSSGAPGSSASPAKPPTPPPSTASSGSRSPPPWTTPAPAYGSTRSAPASSPPT